MTLARSESGELAHMSPAGLISCFSFAPLETANWRKVGSGDLEIRDLAIAKASANRLSGIVVRAGEVGGEIDMVDGARFAFVFVINGEVLFQDGAGRQTAMQAYSAMVSTRYDGRAKWRLSAGAEVMEISSLIDFDPDTSLTNTASWSFQDDEAAAYMMGNGPRPYFLYRDLGAAAATGRALNLTIVAATGEVAGGTGWHTHTMSQFFYVLRGTVKLAVAGQPPLPMKTGAGMCIFAGLAHDVVSWSPDYVCLELCAPADYDTVDAPQPSNLS
jgi:quercetin dioxygenase-like cupin family protein